MAKSFITTTSSEPVVVIVDDQSILAVWLEQFFLESGLAVCRVEAPALAVTLEKLDATHQHIYKLVLLQGFTPHSSWLKDVLLNQVAIQQASQLASQTLSILAARVEPLVIITRKSSLDLSQFSSEIVLKLQLLLRQEQVLTHQALEITRAQIFVGLDTLDYSSEIELPLLYSLIGVDQNVLFNPEVTWALQPISAFYSTVANQLLKPHKPQYVIVGGQKKISSFWLQKIAFLYQQYFGTLPKMVSTPAELTPLPDLQNPVVCQTQDDWTDVLDVKVRGLAQLTKELQDINQSLITTDRSPIYVSVRDLVRDGTQTYSNGTPKPTKSMETGLKPTEAEYDDQVKNGPKKTVKISNEEDNRLINQYIYQSKSEDDEGVVVEEWNQTIEVQDTNNQKLSTTTPESLQDLKNLPQNTQSEPGVVYLDSELQNIFINSRQKQRKVRTVSRVKTTRKLIFKSKRHQALFVGGLGLVGVGVLVGAAMGLYQVSVAVSQNLVFEHIAWQFQQTSQTKKLTSTWLEFLQNQVVQYGKVVKEDLLSRGETLTATATVLNKLQDNSQELQTIVQAWLKGLQGVEEYQPIESNTQLIQATNQTLELNQQLLTALGGIDTANLNSNQQADLAKLKTHTQTVNDLGAQQLQLSNGLLEILGNQTKKTYAILIQNDLELRPTGGFIQNLVLVTFHRGVLTDSQIYSTYELDNRLASVVKPPDEIKEILGEQRWFLRDSNWNPDFPLTAKQVNWFIEESVGRSVDGVIALNYTSIRELLKVTGPLQVDQFNEEISDKNLYDKLEFHAEGKVVDKAGKKVEYTSVILGELLTELKKLPADKASRFFTVIGQGFNQKQVMAVFFNPTTAQVFKELGWDGAVISPQCPSQFLENTCVVDTLYQVDANVGVNKVNAYVEKTVQDNVVLEPKLVTHTRTTTYQNNARLDLWPQGTYRVFTKYLLPPETTLISITINGQAVSSERLKIYAENGKKVVGFLVEVPKQKTLPVVIKYQLSHTFDKPYSYFWFNQKQPGSKESGTATLTLSPGLRARLVAPQPQINGQNLEFMLSSSDHTAIGVTIE